MRQKTVAYVLVFLVAWTGFAGAALTAPFAGTWAVDALRGFSTQPQPEPIDEYTAKTWQYRTSAAIAGTAVTASSCYILVNGAEVQTPSLNSGYIESKVAVRQGDHIQMQIAATNYYTVIVDFVVPKLGALAGGETTYTLGQVDMWPTAHADATINADYAGTDIDAANWDISAGTTYTGVQIILNLETANFANKAMGPQKYTELVGDKKTYSKFIKFDCNDSDITITNVKLEDVPLKMIWSTFADGSDRQQLYEYDQMLVNDNRVSGDGIYILTFDVTCSDADNTIAVSYHVGRTDSTLGVNYDSALTGSAGSADETVTITTE